MKFSVGVIIMSDRAATGEREDKCIPVIESLLKDGNLELIESVAISDDAEIIEKTIRQFISKEYNLILTSGGTGCGQRDNTPDVTKRLLDKATPGLDEAVRAFSSTKARFAVFSRAVSGVAGKSYIVNLPGSPKAVKEILEFILPIIEHPLKLMAGRIKDCQEELSRHDKL